MGTINSILLGILGMVLLVHLGPTIKGFYAGYCDAKKGKPPKQFNQNNNK
jgi:hypothetical protein